MIMDRKHIFCDMERAVLKHLEIFPVVVLSGARQVGKTTLAKRICRKKEGVFLTMESIKTKSEAMDDPDKTLGDGKNFMAIDEIQLYPEMLRQVKYVVDNDRRNGMFLLTCSGDMDWMWGFYDALVGRVMTLHMRPFSQFEIFANGEGMTQGRQNDASEENHCNVIERLFADDSPPDKGCEGLADAVERGGYPMVFSVAKEDKKNVLEQYLYVELAREFQRLFKGKGITDMPKLLGTLAERLGNGKNIKELAASIGQTPHVTDSLCSLFECFFLAEPLPSLREKLRKKEVSRKHRVYLNDSGLAATLLQLDGKDLHGSAHWLGLLRNFVLAELRKHLELSSFLRSASLCYYRESDGIKVDFVLAKNVDKGDLIAIDVKATKNLGRRDGASLAEFKSFMQGRCKRAIVFYEGDRTLRFDDGVEAWPLSSLLEPW